MEDDNFSFDNSGVKTTDLRSNLIEKRYQDIRELPNAFFLILPSYHTSGDNSDGLRKKVFFLI